MDQLANELRAGGLPAQQVTTTKAAFAAHLTSQQRSAAQLWGSPDKAVGPILAARQWTFRSLLAVATALVVGAPLLIEGIGALVGNRSVAVDWSTLASWILAVGGAAVMLALGVSRCTDKRWKSRVVFLIILAAVAVRFLAGPAIFELPAMPLIVIGAVLIATFPYARMHLRRSKNQIRALFPTD